MRRRVTLAITRPDPCATSPPIEASIACGPPARLTQPRALRYRRGAVSEDPRTPVLGGGGGRPPPPPPGPRARRDRRGPRRRRARHRGRGEVPPAAGDPERRPGAPH